MIEMINKRYFVLLDRKLVATASVSIQKMVMMGHWWIDCLLPSISSLNGGCVLSVAMETVGLPL